MVCLHFYFPRQLFFWAVHAISSLSSLCAITHQVFDKMLVRVFFIYLYAYTCYMSAGGSFGSDEEKYAKDVEEIINFGDSA